MIKKTILNNNNLLVLSITQIPSVTLINYPKLEPIDLSCFGQKYNVACNYLSSSWFIRRYYELTGINVMDIQTLISICHKNSSAKQVFEEFAENLGKLLVALDCVYYFQQVGISGEILKAVRWFLPRLKKKINNHDFFLVSASNKWPPVTHIINSIYADPATIRNGHTLFNNRQLRSHTIHSGMLEDYINDL